MSVKTCIFSGVCTALSSLVLVSPRLSRPFSISKVGTRFALNTNGTLRSYFFVSDDDSAPVTGEPSGTNVLSDVSPYPFICGDDGMVSVPLSWTVQESGTYVKCYLVNSDVFDHTFFSFITFNFNGGE